MSRLLRHACALVVGALVLTLVPQLGPAGAIGSGYLCTGYSSCKNAGYGNAGYAGNNHEMYWRMYSGHNCTNYVAYRMVKAGMPNSRPWSGSGNATNWGYAMSRITDHQPRVGAVAWWRANVPGAGSAGHVAYVEKVISPTEIVISEDSWGGDFHWRRLVKGTGWPTGFIHFVDKVIENTRQPRVTGTPQVGVPLTARPGAWKPAANVSFQWLSNGAPIAGATGATYTPDAEQRGRTVSVRVTAKKHGFTSAGVTVASSGPVAPGELTNAGTPVVSGEPFVGQTLTAAPNAWSPRPESTEIRWRADNKTIEGATGPTLRVTQDLVRKRITAVSVATRPGYSKAVSKSAPAGPVVIGAVKVQEPFHVSGRARVGSRLAVTGGSFTPTDAKAAYQWLRNGVPIFGATGATYDLTKADVGTRLTAQVSLTKPDWAAAVVHLPAGRVTTKPELRIAATNRPKGAAVSVRVVAPGVSDPGGRVKIRIGNKKYSVKPDHGRVWVLVEGLRPRKHKVHVQYTGTPVVEAVRGSTYVRIRR